MTSESVAVATGASGAAAVGGASDVVHTTEASSGDGLVRLYGFLCRTCSTSMGIIFLLLALLVPDV